MASLVPSRPEAAVEAKEPSTMPQANAVRYMLLQVDANSNARIEKDEVPKRAAADFRHHARADGQQQQRTARRQELSRSGPGCRQIAGRYVEREGIDVKTELAKLEKSQGEAANRFDEQPMAAGESCAIHSRPGRCLRNSMKTPTVSFEEKEVSDRISRASRAGSCAIADRDSDGRLSRERVSRRGRSKFPIVGRQMKDERKDLKAKKAERKSKSAESSIHRQEIAGAFE